MDVKHQNDGPSKPALHLLVACVMPTCHLTPNYQLRRKVGFIST